MNNQPKFKVGDRVRTKDDIEGCVRRVNSYTIRNVTLRHQYAVEGCPTFEHEDDLTLAPKFKVGDRVRTKDGIVTVVTEVRRVILSHTHAGWDYLVAGYFGPFQEDELTLAPKKPAYIGIGDKVHYMNCVGTPVNAVVTGIAELCGDTARLTLNNGTVVEPDQINAGWYPPISSGKTWAFALRAKVATPCLDDAVVVGRAEFAGDDSDDQYLVEYDDGCRRWWHAGSLKVTP